MDTKQSMNRTLSQFCLLILLWTAGLLLGISFALFEGSCIDYTLYDLATGQASFFRLFIVTFLPYLICVFAFVTQRFCLIYPSLFIVSFLKGFSGMFLTNVLGSGAWVIRLGFLFSASLMAVLIWWLLIRFMCSHKRLCSKDIYLTSGLLLSICILDTFVIFPFVSEIFKYI